MANTPRKIPAFIKKLLPADAAGYGVKDEDRLILQSVVDCEEAAAPRFVTLRYNELAEKNGLEPTTEGNIANKLRKLEKNGYLTSKLATSLLTPAREARYYTRTKKELPARGSE